MTAAARGWLAPQDRADLMRRLGERIGTTEAEKALDRIEAMGRLLTQPFADGQSLRDDEWPSWGEAEPAIKTLREQIKGLRDAVEGVQAIGLDPDRWASESALRLEAEVRASNKRAFEEAARTRRTRAIDERGEVLPAGTRGEAAAELRAEAIRVSPANRIQLSVLQAELRKIDAWAATWRAADFKRKRQSSSRSVDFVRVTVDILHGAGIPVSSHRQGITAKACDAVLRAAAFRKTADADLRKVLGNIQR